MHKRFLKPERSQVFTSLNGFSAAWQESGCSVTNIVVYWSWDILLPDWSQGHISSWNEVTFLQLTWLKLFVGEEAKRRTLSRQHGERSSSTRLGYYLLIYLV